VERQARTDCHRHLATLLRARAAEAPGAPAILALDRAPATYADLVRQLERTRDAFRVAGIGTGHTVASVIPDGPEAAVAFLAIASTAIAAPLNPAYRESELGFYLEDLGARAVVLPAGGAPEARRAAMALGVAIFDLVPDPTVAGLFTLHGEPASAVLEHETASPTDVALVLHTSGTTARPKIVPLAHDNLCISAGNIATSLTLTPVDRCLNIMPLFHVHGLVGALLSTLASGGSIVCTTGFNASRFLQWLADFQPTWYTGVPTMHQAVAERAAAAGWRHGTSLRLIRSCSAALPPTLLAELERRFSVPVIEAYGMTEGAHQIASNPLPPEAHKPGSVGRAAGPEVAVMSEAGVLVGPNQPGEIVIKGSNVMRGYVDPRANASAFADGWFRTGDQGYLDDEAYIFLTGRLKELINRGGEKVAPREIDEALLAHPAVAQAVAFGMADPRLGEVVAAAVVLRPGVHATERQLRDFALLRLAFFKVPERIVFLNELPKGPTGKIQRIGLADRLGLMTPSPPAAEEGLVADAPVDRVAEIAADLLGMPGVDPSKSFLEAGGDSLLGVQFVARLSDAFDVEVSLLDLFDARSLSVLASVIAERVLSEIECLDQDDAVA